MVLVNCKHCDGEFKIKPFALTRGRGVFCSKDCMYSAKRKRISKICPVCKLEFHPKLSDHLRGRAKCCSTKCSAIKRTIRSKEKKGVASGERHWNWKGGVTPKNEKIRRGARYKKFRWKIFKRDNFTCQNCKKRGSYLEVNHIRPFSIFKELIYEPRNCETLCAKCHRKTDTFGTKLMWDMKKNGIEKTRKKYENVPLREC